MNFFLHINRKFIFFFGIVTIVLFLIFVISKQFQLNNIEIELIENNIEDADIEEPKFAINNASKKILITAKKGNFLNNDEVLLNENVRFKSNDFSIESEKVIFNKNEQTAESDSKSLFKSENAIITSDGFNIYDNGDVIIFYGKSFIILK